MQQHTPQPTTSTKRRRVHRVARTNQPQPVHLPTEVSLDQLLTGQPGDNLADLISDETYYVTPTRGVRSALDLPIRATSPTEKHVLRFNPLVLTDEVTQPGTHLPPLRFDEASVRLADLYDDDDEQDDLAWMSSFKPGLGTAFRYSRATARRILRDIHPALTSDFQRQLLRHRLATIQQVQYSLLQNLQTVPQLEAELRAERESNAALRDQLRHRSGPITNTSTQTNHFGGL